MNLRKEMGALLLAVCFQMACGEPGRASADYTEFKATSDKGTTAKRTAENVRALTGVELRNFVGCWSTGNGLILKITEDHVFLSTNNFTPVGYVKEKLENANLVIRLTDRPQFYYLNEVVSFEFDKEADQGQGFPLLHRSFQSIQDFERGDSVGSNAWVRDDCNRWFKDSDELGN